MSCNQAAATRKGACSSLVAAVNRWAWAATASLWASLSGSVFSRYRAKSSAAATTCGICSRTSTAFADPFRRLIRTNRLPSVLPSALLWCLLLGVGLHGQRVVAELSSHQADGRPLEHLIEEGLDLGVFAQWEGLHGQVAVRCDDRADVGGLVASVGE